MKTTPGSSASRSPKNSWLLPALIAIGALGAGITGTLFWMQSRPVSTPALPVVIAAPSTLHEPPATLTMGMTPAQSTLTRGNWYYDHEAWPQAVTNYRETIAQGTDNPDVRTDLGNALRFSGEPQQALEQYRRAHKQNPRHQNSLFNQGALYATDLKQPAKGIAIWREYLKRFPSGQSVKQARLLIARTQKPSRPTR